MFRTHPLEAVFSLIFTARRDLEDRRDAGTFCIGLGDEFDDDRRLVRTGCREKINRWLASPKPASSQPRRTQCCVKRIAPGNVQRPPSSRSSTGSSRRITPPLWRAIKRHRMSSGRPKLARYLVSR